MMTGALMLATVWVTRPTLGFVTTSRLVVVGSGQGRSIPAATKPTNEQRRVGQSERGIRLFSSKDDSSRTTRVAAMVNQHVSRISTLQTLLQQCGAPGSIGCSLPGGDLIPIRGVLGTTYERIDSATPELVESLCDEQPAVLSQEEIGGLHPYLYPLARSTRTGNMICAYCNPPMDVNAPWALVETAINAPGVRLLALNSEHMMRRIVAQVDHLDGEAKGNGLIDLYNHGLGKGLLKDAGLDAPYISGSVAKLGYGLEKYVLLRIGPFPDLYQALSLQHLGKGDVQATLIASESACGKLPGFASTFLSYAKLLKSLPNREEESRDAARNCVRMPLWTVGASFENLKDMAVLAQVANETDAIETVLSKIESVYERIKSAESDSASVPGETTNAAQSPAQIAVEECQDLLNKAILQQQPWTAVRQSVAQIYRAAGSVDMAEFVEEVASSSVTSAATTRNALQ